MYCYLEFKPSYHKNLKLFSIRVKELFKPTVLRKKKATGVVSNLFSCRIYPVFKFSRRSYINSTRHSTMFNVNRL